MENMCYIFTKIKKSSITRVNDNIMDLCFIKLHSLTNYYDKKSFRTNNFGTLVIFNTNLIVFDEYKVNILLKPTSSLETPYL